MRHGSFPHFSKGTLLTNFLGIKIIANLSKNPKNRVEQAYFNNEKIESYINKKYHIVTTEYLKNGGDGIGKIII
jgi:hypothetical protein